MSPHGVTSALRVPADLTVVGFVRSAFACVLEREAWPAEGAGRVLLAGSEAVTNAIDADLAAAGSGTEVRLGFHRVAARVEALQDLVEARAA